MASVKWWCLCAIALLSCRQSKHDASQSAIPGYNLSDPVMIHLKPELDEISGIAFYPKDSSIFAINDEVGVLYKIYLRPRIVIKKWKFSLDGDYEDIVMKDSTFYILQSNGNIDVVRVSAKGISKGQTFAPPIEGYNDFETIYYDDTARVVVLMCKNCLTDSKKSISAYAFNPADNTFSNTPFCKINTDTIGALMHSEYAKFKPSAAAIHPLTGELYILSSVEKAIAIAGRDGSVKEAYPLASHFFKQPEGICFAPNGDMFISNESADAGAATILKYKYKPEIHERD